MLMIAVVIVMIVVNVTVLTVTSRRRSSSSAASRFAVALVAPFQSAVTKTMGFAGDVWFDYFHLVSVAKENKVLSVRLAESIEQNNRLAEMELSNRRLRYFLNLQITMQENVLAAEVISRDPSPWFKTLIIDRGGKDGLAMGTAVVVAEGVAGQVIEVSDHFSKVLLITDRNSAVDALVQRTRARGVIKGDATDRCLFKYALRKHDVRIGDIIVSSGLDGVYPKGLRIGKVAEVVRSNAGIFQEVTVTPFVDFEKIEEVLVVLPVDSRETGGQ